TTADTSCSRDETVPLDETYAETVNYHGRIFQQHALDSKIYYAPIDDEEIARLGNMHTMLRTVFDNRLIFPPVVRPQRILECGFGAAHWAVDVAEHYPDAEVVGLDISPHMIPEEIPNNLDLQVDDLNGEWSRGYLDAMHPQKDPRAALRLKDWMRNAGFTDIESRLLTLPMCPWPTDPRDHAIGALNVSNVSQLLYSMGLYPFTHIRGMPLEDFQLLVAQARSEATNPSYRTYFPLYVFIGRKPHQ
ncbi:hypothetical protein MKX07_008096, partial [Trichoderma sp. CBMAI-0711]